jgi:hypothetical protein
MDCLYNVFFWLTDPDLVPLYQLSEGSNPGLFLLLNNERGTVGNFENVTDATLTPNQDYY